MVGGTQDSVAHPRENSHFEPQGKEKGRNEGGLSNFLGFTGRDLRGFSKRRFKGHQGGPQVSKGPQLWGVCPCPDPHGTSRSRRATQGGGTEDRCAQ